MSAIASSSSAFPPPRLHSPNLPTQPSSSSSPPHLLPTIKLTFKSNFYDVLRLKQSASHKEIKAAYRTLAKRFHPDAMASRPGAPQSSPDHDSLISSTDFIQIQKAYATLSDPPARAAYDRSISRFHMGSTTTSRWETEQCW